MTENSMSSGFKLTSPQLRADSKMLEKHYVVAPRLDRYDRFLVIDKTTLIHVGASLNHLGKKCFAFSSLDKSNIPSIMARI